LIFFKVGRQAQFEPALHLCSHFLSFCSPLSMKKQWNVDLFIFSFPTKTCNGSCSFCRKNISKLSKNIVAVKPIVLSVLTDRNVGHGNICCRLLIDNAHVGIQAYGNIHRVAKSPQPWLLTKWQKNLLSKAKRRCRSQKVSGLNCQDRQYASNSGARF